MTNWEVERTIREVLFVDADNENTWTDLRDSEMLRVKDVFVESKASPSKGFFESTESFFVPKGVDALNILEHEKVNFIVLVEMPKKRCELAG
ncbi:hypothetical protein HAHE_15530 [Haloferula helveola]|uniref:Uncharacterized protein n=1 Tax=Haloferula helveola TaxID=490095 RepID=A0ABM7RF60_9BACT|nr:hypothetical protein HAHE_15530 [Haloferula helveola]